LNFVDYLVDTDITTTVNYDKTLVFIYRRKKKTTKCPYYNVVRLKSLPLTDDKTNLPNLIQ